MVINEYGIKTIQGEITLQTDDWNIFLSGTKILERGKILLSVFRRCNIKDDPVNSKVFRRVFSIIFSFLNTVLRTGILATYNQLRQQQLVVPEITW
ncbi:MAG: hypothetical protein ACLS3C_18170 [Oscillospiraceae bacterium]